MQATIFPQDESMRNVLNVYEINDTRSGFPEA